MTRCGKARMLMTRILILSKSHDLSRALAEAWTRIMGEAAQSRTVLGDIHSLFGGVSPARKDGLTSLAFGSEMVRPLPPDSAIPAASVPAVSGKPYDLQAGGG